MYSQKIVELFDRLGIAVGDTIKVDSKELSFEGQLMPNTESGNENTIVIKLKNGYNVGVAFDEKVRVKKLETMKKPAEFPFAKLKADPKLPSVTIIWVGGTIGSKVAYDTGGVSMTVKPEELLYYIPEIGKIANVTVNHLFSIASEDLTYLEWQKIAAETAKALNGGARGVVITHGTDTMHFTAAALSFMLQGLNAPVVLTGAQRSGDRGSSDSFMNLIAAVRFAANSNVAEVGICMHATSSDDRMVLIRGVRARKMHTSRRDAFRPVNDKPIAEMTQQGEITYIGDYRKVEKSRAKIEAKTNFEPKVALVSAYPNSDPQVLEYYLDKGYRGIIIQGTGLGHTPTSVGHEGKSWLGHIRNAVSGGAIVGMTSQCLYGRVNSNVYKNLRLISNAGAIYCEDMLPETALVKLGWLLGNDTTEKAKGMLNKNIAGEIKERLEFDEFLV